jgi:aspartokinase
MGKIHLGGIKLLKDCCRIAAFGNEEDELLASIAAGMRENQVNMPFLTHLADDGSGRSITTLTTENAFGQPACDFLKPVIKSPAALSSCPDTAILSIFPHDQKPAVAGNLLELLARLRIQPFALACSPSGLSVLVSDSNVPDIIDGIFDVFAFASYGSPLDWYAAYRGQEQVLKEIISSYQEKIVKAFYIMQQTGLDLWSARVGDEHLLDFAEALKTLDGMDVKMPLVTGHRLSDSGWLFACCFPREKRDTLADLFGSHSTPPLAVRSGSVGVCYIHGPHFIDRYGIADALVTCLRRGAVKLVALSCTLSSISFMVEAGAIDAAVKALEPGFQVPTRRHHKAD